ELLTRPRYEVFPVEGIADQVATHVPTEIKVAVTSSPKRGIEATLRLCEELASVRLQVAAHLAACVVRDAECLRDVLEQLAGRGGSEPSEPAASSCRSTSEFQGRLRAGSSFGSRRGSESASRRGSSAGKAAWSRACSCAAATGPAP